MKKMLGARSWARLDKIRGMTAECRIFGAPEEDLGDPVASALGKAPAKSGSVTESRFFSSLAAARVC